MPAPFAALESRVNDAVLERLTNAFAMVGGEPVPVIFEDPYATPFDGEVDASAPSCTGSVAVLGSFERDDAITVNDTAYEVATAGPDGAGMVRLTLRKV